MDNWPKVTAEGWRWNAHWGHMLNLRVFDVSLTLCSKTAPYLVILLAQYFFLNIFIGVYG